jgi:hypothetical protein
MKQCEKSNPVLYSLTGSFKATSHRRFCNACKRTVTAFADNGKWLKVDSYFKSTDQSIFEISLLDTILPWVAIAGLTFQEIAKHYSLVWTDQSSYRLLGTSSETRIKMNADRLEDAFLKYLMYRMYESEGKLDELPLITNPGTLDDLLHKYYTKSKPNSGAAHTCADVGCRAGMVIVDGNEKVRRKVCSVDPTKIIPGVDIPVDTLNFTGCCPLSPISGNQHVAPSKFCEIHCYLDGRKRKPTITPGFPMILPRSSAPLPHPHDNVHFTSGCKKVANVDKFFATTAGTLMIVRPCGYIVNHCEMFRAESCSQVGAFLYDTFRSVPDRLQIIAYDRACDLYPLVCRLAKADYDWASFLASREFMVDIFHANKHTEKKCYPPTNPECTYHPDIPKFAAVREANTEICEQTFSWWNKFRGMIANMTYTRRQFVLDHAIQYRNNHILEIKMT